MSAFIVSRRHVAALVKFAILHNASSSAEPHACTFADTLLRENVRSVDYRYNETNGAVERFTIAEINAAPELSPVSALKQCACLHYQSCETPDYEQRPAYKLLLVIEACARALGGKRNGAGWESAPWGLDEFDPQDFPRGARSDRQVSIG